MKGLSHFRCSKESVPAYRKAYFLSYIGSGFAADVRSPSSPIPFHAYLSLIFVLLLRNVKISIMEQSQAERMHSMLT